MCSGIILATKVNGNTKKITPADTTQKASEYICDVKDRLAEVKKDNATLQSNRYDFQQRRLAKTTASATTYFLYGQTGLLAEYQSNGDFIQGYGYNPKGSYTTNPQYTITPKASGTGYDVNFYHNDHLATPQKLTNATGEISWAMESTAFGETTITTQTTTNNLRFPGQYADDDIGLSQNYFRDYAPHLGRYFESDPIGLDGGVNTYVYVLNSPLMYDDQYGLDIWLEGAVEGEGGLGLHQSICVETKGSVVLSKHKVPRLCISFGTNDNSNCILDECNGEVYPDTSAPGEKIKYMVTTPEEDKKAYETFTNLLGRKGKYKTLYKNCRSFVNNLFLQLEREFNKKPFKNRYWPN